MEIYVKYPVIQMSVHIRHIGMDFIVQVWHRYVLLVQNGMVNNVLQPNQNVQMVLIGLEQFVNLFHHNVHHN
jgi:hypothetical protein